jgi:hypothetical protein
MKSTLRIALATGAVVIMGSAAATDLTSCAATYTVAGGQYSAVGNNSASAIAYSRADQARAASVATEWNGSAHQASTAFRDQVQRQSSQFYRTGWTQLNQALAACDRVSIPSVARNGGNGNTVARDIRLIQSMPR